MIAVREGGQRQSPREGTCDRGGGVAAVAGGAQRRSGGIGGGRGQGPSPAGGLLRTPWTETPCVWGPMRATAHQGRAGAGRAIGVAIAEVSPQS